MRYGYGYIQQGWQWMICGVGPPVPPRNTSAICGRTAGGLIEKRNGREMLRSLQRRICCKPNVSMRPKLKQQYNMCFCSSESVCVLRDPKLQLIHHLN